MKYRKRTNLCAVHIFAYFFAAPHTLQNRAIKIILGINRYVSTEEMNNLHVQVSLMKLSERRKLFMLKMMYEYSQYEECVDHYKPKV